MTTRKSPAARSAATGRDLTAEVTFLTRALKAPTLREAVPRLAERARAESWTHEEFLVACLQREVSARESHGGEGRIRAARFPARKSLEEFDYDHARGLKRDLIAHLGTLDFVAARENVVFLGPPGTGKTHLATGIAIRACQAGHRVQFATASEWVARLAEAHHAGRLQDELVRLGRYPLLVVDALTVSTSTPEYPGAPITVGQRIIADAGAEWVYVQVATSKSCTVGDFVVVTNHSTWQIDQLSNTTGKNFLGSMVGVAGATATAGQYLWIQVRGYVASVHCATSSTDKPAKKRYSTMRACVASNAARRVRASSSASMSMPEPISACTDSSNTTHS